MSSVGRRSRDIAIFRLLCLYLGVSEANYC